MRNSLIAAALVLSQITRVPRTEEWIPVRVVSLNYPIVAAQAQIAGTVQIVIALNDRGIVQDIVSETGNSILAAAAERNIRTWKFGRLPGAGKTSIGRTVRVTYVFKLEDVSHSTTPQSKFMYEYPETATITVPRPHWQPRR